MQTECTSKVLYLRKFKSLFTLNLFGNPVSKDEDYSFFIAAYFPKLMFLDYRLLDETTVSTDSGVFIQTQVISIEYHSLFTLNHFFTSFSFMQNCRIKSHISMCRKMKHLSNTTVVLRR